MTKLLGVRKPNKRELEEHSCDLVFIRENEKGREFKIFFSLPTKDYGWFQWGQPDSILKDNVDDIEKYIDQRFIN